MSERNTSRKLEGFKLLFESMDAADFRTARSTVFIIYKLSNAFYQVLESLMTDVEALKDVVSEMMKTGLVAPPGKEIKGIITSEELLKILSEEKDYIQRMMKPKKGDSHQSGGYM